jgi:hypothetical protein
VSDSEELECGEGTATAGEVVGGAALDRECVAGAGEIHVAETGLAERGDSDGAQLGAAVGPVPEHDGGQVSSPRGGESSRV